MIQDGEMIRRLNFLRSQKTFVLKEVGDIGEAEVLSIPIIPECGIFCVPGTTILKSGRLLESVFRTDTDGGGELNSVYWWIDRNWYEHRDTDIQNVLGLEDKEIFPFVWEYSTKLTRDIFHE